MDIRGRHQRRTATCHSRLTEIPMNGTAGYSVLSIPRVSLTHLCPPDAMWAMAVEALAFKTQAGKAFTCLACRAKVNHRFQPSNTAARSGNFAEAVCE